jgi:hypothetical protein
MSINDAFRLIDRDQAVSLGCFVVFLATLIWA